jgi:hypothetical protein
MKLALATATILPAGIWTNAATTRRGGRSSSSSSSSNSNSSSNSSSSHRLSSDNSAAPLPSPGTNNKNDEADVERRFRSFLWNRTTRRPTSGSCGCCPTANFLVVRQGGPRSRFGNCAYGSILCCYTTGRSRDTRRRRRRRWRRRLRQVATAGTTVTTTAAAPERLRTIPTGDASVRCASYDADWIQDRHLEAIVVSLPPGQRRAPRTVEFNARTPNRRPGTVLAFRIHRDAALVAGEPTWHKNLPVLAEAMRTHRCPLHTTPGRGRGRRGPGGRPRRHDRGRGDRGGAAPRPGMGRAETTRGPTSPSCSARSGPTWGCGRSPPGGERRVYIGYSDKADSAGMKDLWSAVFANGTIERVNVQGVGGDFYFRAGAPGRMRAPRRGDAPVQPNRDAHPVQTPHARRKHHGRPGGADPVPEPPPAPSFSIAQDGRRQWY